MRECARRLLAGEALRAICGDLNERGVSTVAGGQWKTQTLRRMLMSPRISGQREHRGEIVGQSEWPAIITPAETTRIRALLSDPSRRTNKSARRYLLVRLLRCGRCGELLVSRPTASGRRRYVCAKGPNFSGCGHMYIEADTLELFVVEAVLHRLDSPELAAALNGARAATRTWSAPRQKSSRHRHSSTSLRLPMATRRSASPSGWQPASRSSSA